jgi:hypothetical protein
MEGYQSFWMGIQDFCRHFTHVIETRGVPASWQSAAVTCSSERPSYPLVSVTGHAQAVFVLSQPDERLSPAERRVGDEGYARGIGLRIYRCRIVAPPPNSVGVRQNVSSPFRNLEMLVEKTAVKARSVVVEVPRLEPASLYVAVADSESPLECATLRVLTSSAMRFRELSAPESTYFLEAQETAVAVAEFDSFTTEASEEAREHVASRQRDPRQDSMVRPPDAREVEGFAGWRDWLSEVEDAFGPAPMPPFLKACLTSCGAGDC